MKPTVEDKAPKHFRRLRIAIMIRRHGSSSDSNTDQLTEVTDTVICILHPYHILDGLHN
jgi:hypothetical protein